jgi:hypothetical protein
MGPTKPGKTKRLQASADEIAAQIRKYIAAVPGLENVSIEVVRLAQPDRNGCNWMVKHSRIPPGCVADSVRLFFDIIEHTQSGFNLWELH